jgi:hypothetical protein
METEFNRILDEKRNKLVNQVNAKLQEIKNDADRAMKPQQGKQGGWNRLVKDSAQWVEEGTPVVEKIAKLLAKSKDACKSSG